MTDPLCSRCGELIRGTVCAGPYGQRLHFGCDGGRSTVDVTHNALPLAAFGDDISFYDPAAEDAFRAGTHGRLRVVGALSGDLLCEFVSAPTSSILQTKVQIERTLGIPVDEQRLLSGIHQIHDCELLDGILRDQPQDFPSHEATWTISLGVVPRADYMAAQTEIDERMRIVLVDWLVEVHELYKLRQVTLFLAINTMDQYLALRKVSRRDLQLVGVVALLIASKFEEIHPPTVEQVTRITDNAYTEADVKTMECKMLSMLEFRISHVTVVDFLAPFQASPECSDIHGELAAYIAEMSLLFLSMLRYHPAQIAGAAVLLSSVTLGLPPWPLAIAQRSPYPEHMIRQCASELGRLQASSSAASYTALFRKFSKQTRHNVAQMGAI